MDLKLVKLIYEWAKAERAFVLTVDSKTRKEFEAQDHMEKARREVIMLLPQEDEDVC